jgi:hypothetical protein
MKALLIPLPMFHLSSGKNVEGTGAYDESGARSEEHYPVHGASAVALPEPLRTPIPVQPAPLGRMLMSASRGKMDRTT